MPKTIAMTNEEYEALYEISRSEKMVDALARRGLVEFRYEGPAALFGLSKIYLTEVTAVTL